MSIEGQKITVVGKVDPAKLRDKVEQKAHTKVEQISPQPKKDGGDKENSGGKVNDGGDNGKKEKKKDNDKKSNDKSDQKAKEKEVRFILPSFFINCIPPDHSYWCFWSQLLLYIPIVRLCVRSLCSN